MNQKPKIVIISGVQGDTRRYRAFHLFEQLCLAGYHSCIGHITQNKIQDLVQSSQILILQRVSWDEKVESLIKIARKHGNIIISDVDDLIFEPEAMRWVDAPDFSDPIRSKLYLQNLLRNRRTILESDAIITSTEFLADQVRKLGKPSWVHRNGFSLEMAFLSSKSIESISISRKTIIGYASGTPTHDRDFALVLPILKHTIEKHKDVFIQIIGYLQTNVVDYEDRIYHIPFVPWRNLPNLLSKFSINLAPLRTDNPFSQSKSEIKYMEAALVKVPTIASPTQAYRFAIRNGENGKLANSESEWQDALDQLITDPSYRLLMGERAFNDVMQRYAPWLRAIEIVNTLNQILDFLNVSFERFERNDILIPEKLDEISVPSNQENIPTLINRGIYSLRYRGMITLLAEIWVYFRRSISKVIPFSAVSRE